VPLVMQPSLTGPLRCRVRPGPCRGQASSPIISISSMAGPWAGPSRCTKCVRTATDASKVAGGRFSRRSQRFEGLADASHHVGKVVDAFSVEVEVLRVRQAAVERLDQFDLRRSRPDEAVTGREAGLFPVEFGGGQFKIRYLLSVGPPPFLVIGDGAVEVFHDDADVKERRKADGRGYLPYFDELSCVRSAVRPGRRGSVAGRRGRALPPGTCGSDSAGLAGAHTPPTGLAGAPRGVVVGRRCAGNPARPVSQRDEAVQRCGVLSAAHRPTAPRTWRGRASASPR